MQPAVRHSPKAETLPPDPARGIFARPGQRPAILRISTDPCDSSQDGVPVPRGPALKVRGSRTPDFVFADAPVLGTPDRAGAVNRARRHSHRISADLCAAFNGCLIHQPTAQGGAT